MTITDQDLCDAVERQGIALTELLIERQMAPSSLVSKQTFMIDDQDMSPAVLDSLLTTIIVTTKVVGNGDLIRSSFYCAYQTRGEIKPKTALWVYDFAGDVPLEGLEPEQSQMLLGSLMSLTKGVRSWSLDSTMESTTAFFFFALGKRCRQYVDDTLALASLGEQLDFDMEKLLSEVDDDE